MKELSVPEGQVTKTQFIEQKLAEYFKPTGGKTVDELGQEQTEEIFLRAIKDFKDENISLDDLSFVAGKLWWSATEKEKGFSKELMDILTAGEEMDFYVRKVSEPQLDTIFLGFLKDILEFYEDKTKSKAERVE